MTAFTDNGKTAATPTTTTPRPVGTGTPYQDASPRQVHQWLSSGEAVLVDVREPDEHARERIDGSRLIPLSRLNPAQAAALAKPGQRLVVHCRSGRRSADALRKIASVSGPGLTIVNMTGGLEAWKQENLPVEVNTKVFSMSTMRQVQLVIGIGVLAGSALAWLVHPGFIGVAAFFGAGLTFAGATGTCALATLIGKMPWNKGAPCAEACAGGTCG